MHDLWTVQTGFNLGTYQERVPTTITLPVSGADTITTIAGTIPPGLRLEGSNLIGTPFQVSRSTQYEFCLRAKHSFLIFIILMLIYFLFATSCLLSRSEVCGHCAYRPAAIGSPLFHRFAEPFSG